MREQQMKMTRIAVAVSTALLASSAFATNGMKMEGYGPVSAAMGGTAQAYNNGLGGMMNNPATMGMGSKSGNKFQVAIGGLNPTISSEHKASGAKTDSSGSFIMPGFGYATKKNGFVWGVGVMAQGGMGTDYGKAGQGDLFAGGMSTQGMGATGDNAFGPGTPNAGSQTQLSGLNVKSEVAVGRLIVPLAFDINEQLTIGGSLDYVWGGMDLQMDMDGNSFNNLLAGNGGAVSGSMRTGLENFMAPDSMGNMINQQTGGSNPVPANGPAAINQVNYARFDFTDGSDFTQATKGAGFAGKLGATFRINNQWTVGASYHSKTAMSDFEGDAELSMGVSMAGSDNSGNLTYGNTLAAIKGKIKVKDFEWPEMMSVGVTWKPNDKWMVSADFKQIKWSAVMDKFSMTFDADSSQTGQLAQGFSNATLNVEMDQNWDDQTVIMLGGQFKPNKNLALRAGYNIASNPVPDETLNPLFPATIESHYTAGLGWNMSKEQAIDVAVTVAPEVSATGPTGVTTTHSQFNWQLMYSYAWGVVKK